LGDPADDLAIVTRCSRRPFKVADGLARLLESDNARSEVELTPSEVHLHEFSLAARWYLDEAEASPGQPWVETQHQVLRGLLRRIDR
jgi:hypothetical protein